MPDDLPIHTLRLWRPKPVPGAVPQPWRGDELPLDVGDIEADHFVPLRDWRAERDKGIAGGHVCRVERPGMVKEQQGEQPREVTWKEDRDGNHKAALDRRAEGKALFYEAEKLNREVSNANARARHFEKLEAQCRADLAEEKRLHQQDVDELKAERERLRAALEGAEFALRDARNGLDFGLGCARDVEGDMAPTPIATRTVRADRHLARARRAHAALHTVLAGGNWAEGMGDEEDQGEPLLDVVARCREDEGSPSDYRAAFEYDEGVIRGLTAKMNRREEEVEGLAKSAALAIRWLSIPPTSIGALRAGLERADFTLDKDGWLSFESGYTEPDDDHQQRLDELTDQILLEHFAGQEADRGTAAKMARQRMERQEEAVTIGRLQREIFREDWLEKLKQIVDRQAEDAGLWFDAPSSATAYIQQELRRLHQAVEVANEIGGRDA